MNAGVLKSLGITKTHSVGTEQIQRAKYTGETGQEVISSW